MLIYNKRTNDINIRSTQSKRKIFILNHGLASGGTDSFVINLMKGLDKNKYEIALVMAVDKDGSRQFREQEVEELDIPIYRTCDLNGMKKIVKHCFLLYRLLKEEKTDIFHANMDLFNGFNMLVACWQECQPVYVTRIIHVANMR